MNRRTLTLLVALLMLVGHMGQVMAERNRATDGLSATSAQRSSHIGEGESATWRNKQGVAVGRFTAILDGVDLKHRAIWLNDHRYELYPGYIAVDSDSRTINITTIPLGKWVYVEIKENSRRPINPYLVKLRYTR